MRTRLPAWWSLTCWTTCFNPRAREDATGAGVHLQIPQGVSIHAPVRTRPDTALTVVRTLGFNPRAREDATVTMLCRLGLRPSFNPRAREDATLRRVGYCSSI
ncbi:hypothetical protein [Xanthomonas oryzae pv. oryzae MAFF 311018]|nr:hypothetical protein [Xanthomonas oryzae pv. oryzae MAFF 311018]